MPGRALSLPMPCPDRVTWAAILVQ
jgi:hypothetical protein